MTTVNNKPKLVLLLVFFFITNSFWLVANTIPVYDYVLLGVIFEILWLPMILLTFAIPVVSLVFFFKDGRNVKSWFLYIAIVSLLLIVIYFLQ